MAMAPDPGPASSRPTGAAALVRAALQALVKEARRARLYGTPSAEASSRFTTMYLSGIDQALAESPVLALDVAADAIRLGEVVVLAASERRGDVVDNLYAEGLRGITIELGVSDTELMLLGQLLLTPWAEAHAEQRTLDELVWESDFHHIFFELLERLGDDEGDELGGDSPLVKSIAGLVAELNRDAGDESSRIRQDEFVVMRRLQEELGAELVGTGAATRGTETTVSPMLARAVAAANDGQDLDDIDVVGLLGATVSHGADDAAETMVATALFHYVIGALEANTEVGSSVLARLREAMDPDSARHAEFRLALRRVSGALGEPPLSERVLGLTEAGESRELAGVLFTLFGAIEGELARIALAGSLPGWAVRVLADAWLMDAPPADPAWQVRRLLADGSFGAIRLGLALAARVDNVGLVEPILPLTGHVDGRVREAALVALRRHQTPRLRSIVHERLGDPEEAVRLEALRYVVAYRDVEMAHRIEQRLTTASPADASDAEMRALAIAVGRLLRDRGETHLIPVALGARPTAHPAAARSALHGLRAIGSASARSAIARIGAEVPELRATADELLGVRA